MSRKTYFIGWFLLLITCIWWSALHEWDAPVQFATLFIVWMFVYLAMQAGPRKK